MTAITKGNKNMPMSIAGYFRPDALTSNDDFFEHALAWKTSTSCCKNALNRGQGVYTSRTPNQVKDSNLPEIGEYCLTIRQRFHFEKQFGVAFLVFLTARFLLNNWPLGIGFFCAASIPKYGSTESCHWPKSGLQERVLYVKLSKHEAYAYLTLPLKMFTLETRAATEDLKPNRKTSAMQLQQLKTNSK